MPASGSGSRAPPRVLQRCFHPSQISAAMFGPGFWLFRSQTTPGQDLWRPALGGIRALNLLGKKLLKNTLQAGYPGEGDDIPDIHPLDKPGWLDLVVELFNEASSSDNSVIVKHGNGRNGPTF